MAWVRKHDGHLDEPWWRRLGNDGRLLWDGVLCKLNQNLTDGVIADYVVEDWAHYVGLKTKVKQRKAIDDLVLVGAWHDHENIVDCEDCLAAVAGSVGQLTEGSFYHHNYLDTQPQSDEIRDPLEKRRARRRKQLQRDEALCYSIRTRDHDRCRYCACEVKFQARTGDQSGTYDHLNPMDFGSSTPGDNDGGNSLHKVVVACRRCNGIKKNRTPTEANMPLLPVPSNDDPITEAARTVLAADQGTDDSGQDHPGRGQGSRAPAREAGQGQDGPGRGQGRAGPDLAGSGRASRRGGPGKAGGGPSRGGAGRGGAPPPPSSSRSSKGRDAVVGGLEP